VCLQVKVFPKFISGEDLFGLNETNVIKVLESLPGIESLTDYHFKYGRNPLLELPLAVNPTGCARSEPLMRTRVKRIHNFQRSMTFNPPADKKTGNGLSRAAKESVPLLIGLETTGPYSKNFVQSKSSQYRKMKQEWRQNVVLARSGIQGLGLYAARDIEKHQVSILLKPFFPLRSFGATTIDVMTFGIIAKTLFFCYAVSFVLSVVTLQSHKLEYLAWQSLTA